MPKSQEYIIRQKISTPLEFHVEFFGIFSEFFRNFQIQNPIPGISGFTGFLQRFHISIPGISGFFTRNFFWIFKSLENFGIFGIFRSSPKIFYYKKSRSRISGIGIRDSEKSHPEANSVQRGFSAGLNNLFLKLSIFFVFIIGAEKGMFQFPVAVALW